VKKKQALYQWELGDNFPPHLKTVPNPQSATSIFDFKRLYDTLQTVFPWVPDIDFFHDLAPSGNSTMASLEARNKLLHFTAFGTMYTAENVGLRRDWYTDAVLGQQQFTGVNPVSITLATPEWIQAFAKAATDQKNTTASQLISNSAGSLYVQDCSYFRRVTGMGTTEEITSDFGDATGQHPRFGCASVSLFLLSAPGKLHPMAIILDYNGSVDPNVSVTIFNRHLSPGFSPMRQPTGLGDTQRCVLRSQIGSVTN